LQTTGSPPPEDELLVAAGAAAAAGAAVAGAAAAAVLPLDAALFTPPCPLQAPRPPWGEVVPSLQTTGPPLPEDEPLVAAGAAPAAGAAGAAVAGAAAAAVLPLEAALFTPPCPLQAPRPPCGEVVPSLHVTGPLDASCADKNPGAASSAAVSNTVRMSPSSLVFARFMCSSPLLGYR
jgi:hypothetical protein